MDRPITTLFMLMSVDGKITPGLSDTLDFDQDLPHIKGVGEGLSQYYDIEKTTDLYAGNTGPIGLWTAVSWCVLPFVVPDILKLCLALLIGRRLKQISKPL